MGANPGLAFLRILGKLAECLNGEIPGVMATEFIRIGGARQHNLKNLTLSIPRGQLVVIFMTGWLGSSSMFLVTWILYLGSTEVTRVTAPLVNETVLVRPSKPLGGGQPQADWGDGQALSPPKLL